MKRPEIRPLLLAGRSLRAIALGGMLAAGLATLPSAARADCDVPDNGIPEESLLSKLGPAWVSLGGLRPALAKGGIGVSGTYYGEAFANSGGFKQGGKYDGVLDVAIDADMHKLGFWKGLCFHTNGFQIHGQSITAANIGSLMPVSSLEATPQHSAVRAVARAAYVQRQARGEGWSARRRYGIHPVRGRRILPERHLGLAVDHRRRLAERRSGLSAGHARRSRRRHAKRQVPAFGRRL